MYINSYVINYREGQSQLQPNMYKDVIVLKCSQVQVMFTSSVKHTNIVNDVGYIDNDGSKLKT